MYTSNTGNVSRIPGFKRRGTFSLAKRTNLRTKTFRSVVLGPIAPPTDFATSYAIQSSFAT